ncbi:MAG: protein kinase [Pyrinomonadaceae bacterium]
MTLPSGTKLGRYEIRSKIGEGGMGEVYRAHDTQLDRNVALKILSPELSVNQERMRRFVQEAKAAAALNHPNIAHIYEIGRSPTVRKGSNATSGTGDEIHFIAMEYIEGHTLREKIHREKAKLLKLLKYLVQVAEGLAKAHSAGIVHRDLKPDNIMVTPDGYAKILDFGLAKLIETVGPAQGLSSELPTAILQQHSTPGMIMGTAGYMSPEQAQGKVNLVDHRSDIFSFGCILFEAATGQKAFAGKDAIDSLHKIVHAPPPQIKDLNPVAPDGLQRIVRRCLAKDTEKRYQSIKDVAIELEELRQELKGETEQDYSVAAARSDPSAIVSGAQSGVDSSSRSGIAAATAEGPHSLSSAEYIVSEIKRHKLGALLLIGLSALGLGWGLYKFLSSKRAPNLQAMKMVRLTNNGRVGSASISPDGKYVAYSARDEAGLSSLWVRHVATTSHVQVVPLDGPDVTFGQSTFSPDGNYIYYLRAERGRPGVLCQVPVLGGTSKKLLEDVTRISFSPDGKRFGFIRRYATEGQDALIVVNADGTGEQKLATRTHPDFFLPGTAWSPDGQTIACPVGGFTGGYYRSVAVVNISDGAQKLLTSSKWYGVERLAWLPDGSGIITTAQERAGDQYQLWQISYRDGEARTLTSDLSDYHLVSLTADAGALVTVVSDITSNIWLVPNGEWGNGRQVTSSKSNGIGSTALLSDGRIIYESRAGGNSDLWIMDADGRNQKQLTDDAYNERFALATPDGRHVVFGSARPGTQLWRMDIDGSNAKLLTDSPGLGATISPDGKWIAYTTFGPGGFSIWKVSINGGEPVQISNKYSLSPAISPDGKLIACYYLDERTGTTKIALIPFEGGEPVKIFEPQVVEFGTHPVRWTHDGRALTYIVNRGGVSNIWIQPLDGSSPTQLTDFKSDRIFSFDWSRDGKWLALSRGPEQRDVVLMSDFK